MSRILEKIYVLFRMNILIFVLLAITVIALFAHQNGLDVIEPLYLHDYPYIILAQSVYKYLGVLRLCELPRNF